MHYLHTLDSLVVEDAGVALGCQTIENRVVEDAGVALGCYWHLVVLVENGEDIVDCNIVAGTAGTSCLYPCCCNKVTSQEADYFMLARLSHK